MACRWPAAPLRPASALAGAAGHCGRLRSDGTRRRRRRSSDPIGQCSDRNPGVRPGHPATVPYRTTPGTSHRPRCNPIGQSIRFKRIGSSQPLPGP
eukprot:677536-Hanusia_phi.AAC.1